MSILSLIDAAIETIDSVEEKDCDNVYTPNAKDILEINNCINDYMHCLDEGDGERMATLFTKDGKCEIKKINKTITGRDAIKTFCINLHRKFKSASHFESNVVIKFENSSSATNLSYWKAIDGGNIISYGLHKDRFVKDNDDHWRMVHRIIEHTWSKS